MNTVVIGVGGLGHVVVQILSAVCSSTIACDINDEKLELAKNMALNIP
jgi:propanol-preferring alcohol dehydrogenase